MYTLAPSKHNHPNSVSKNKLEKAAWYKILYYSYNVPHTPNHFGGEAILRYFNEVPFFQSSQQCQQPLFL